jgi:hypothetical protein
MFDINERGLIPFVREHIPGIPPPELELRDGDDVTLKINGANVNIVNIRSIGGNDYAGTVSGFPHGYFTTFRELELGQEVIFRKENVFTVGQRM